MTNLSENNKFLADIQTSFTITCPSNFLEGHEENHNTLQPGVSVFQA
jgi:hypothetical protein